MGHASDQIAGLVVLGASWAEGDDGAAEVAADCDAWGCELWDVDVFPSFLSVSIEVAAVLLCYITSLLD